MIKIIKYSNQKSKTFLEKNLSTKRLESNKIESDVKKILYDTKNNKDKALFKYVKKVDNIQNPKNTLKIKASEIKKAKNLCDGKSIKALKIAAKRIEKFQKYHY